LKEKPAQAPKSPTQFSEEAKKAFKAKVGLSAIKAHRTLAQCERMGAARTQLA
jgi:hypothetical protein